MTNKFITCIECPNGCRLQVVLDEGKIESVTGNLCPRGITYAQSELTDPRRVVTSTVRTVNGGLVPVKTATPVRKSEIFAVMKKINAVVAPLPIKVGDVLLEKVDEDIPLIATADCEK